jgi:hypothetical protein
MPVVRNMLSLLATALAAAGCAGSGPGGGPDAVASAEGSERVRSVDSGGIECGQPVPAPTGAGLTLVARFPAAARTGGLVTGTVEVRSQGAIRGVVGPRAEAFLIRAGRVVTAPVAQDLSGRRWNLAPGGVEHLPADAQLTACQPGGGPLPPGEYQLYTRLVITLDDGPRVAAVGGPWTLRVTA